MTHVTDQIETYLTGGLSPEEKSAFEEHVATCDVCAVALADARAADAAMTDLFAAARPSADFEDRMIHAIAMPHPWLSRPIVHPMVRRAAVGIAAAVMISGIGYLVNRGLEEGRMPGLAFLDEGLRARTSSNLKNIAAATITYSASGNRGYPRTYFFSADQMGRGVTNSDVAFDSVDSSLLSTDGKGQPDASKRAWMTTRNPTSSPKLGDMTWKMEIPRGGITTSENLALGMAGGLIKDKEGEIGREGKGKLAWNEADVNGPTSRERSAGRGGELNTWALSDGGAVYTPEGGQSNNLGFKATAEGIKGTTKSGAGTLTLNGDNSYAGATTINGGVLSSGGTATLGSSATNGIFRGGVDGEKLDESRKQLVTDYYAAKLPPSSGTPNVALGDLARDGTAMNYAYFGTQAAGAQQMNKGLGGISAATNAPMPGLAIPEGKPVISNAAGDLGNRSQPEAGVVAGTGLSVNVTNGNISNDGLQKPNVEFAEAGKKVTVANPTGGAARGAVDGRVTELEAQVAEKDQALAQQTAANTAATAALQVAQSDIKGRHEKAGADALVTGARDAQAAGRVEEAREKYAEAVHKDPTNAAAQHGLDEVLTLEGHNPNAPSSLAAESEAVNTRRQEITYRANIAVEEAKKATAEHKWDAAATALERAKLAANADPAVFDPVTLKKMEAEIAAANKAFNDEEDSEIQRKLHDPAQAGLVDVDDSRERAILERRHTIVDLGRKADDLRKQGKVKEAEGILAQIAQLQPNTTDNTKPNPAAPVVPAHAVPGHVEAPAAARPKIIRTGEMEFEVTSFEMAVETITKVVEEEGGYVSTTNSDKLPNGKVKGEVVMRVTPDRLDTLVLKLRGIGDLKTQNIRAQDITKQYTDLESRLRAAQIMCDQLLDIIKSGKAQMKDLLEAEKQLGVYREKVEQLTGEINYYANQISLSTLTLTLFERDIRTPALASENETVTMTVVTEKVDEAAVKAKDAIAAAKGRIIASNQAQTDEGQSTATIKAQVPPDAAEEVIAKLKQIDGQLDHFDRQRSQTTSNGSSPVDARAADPLKVKREDVTIDLTLYNLAKLTPRRSTSLALAATDVDEAKHLLEEQVRSAGGRIIDSRTEYPRPDQKKGTISFDVPTEKADGLIATLKNLGETLQISTIENPSGQGVTESKRGFSAVIFDMASVEPRRQTTLTLVTPTVDVTQNSLADQVKAAGGRVIGRKIEHPAANQSMGILAFEIPAAKADAFLLAMKANGEMLQVNTADNQAAQNVTDSKRGFAVTILDLAGVLPRRVTSMTVVTNTVDATEATLVDQIRQEGGRVINRKVDHPAPDQSVGSVTFEMPAEKADAFLLATKQMGETLGVSTADNTGAPIVTDAKRGFAITLRSLTTFKAREAEQVTLASANVRDSFNDLRNLVHAQAGRVLTEHLNEEDSSNSVGQLEFEVSREAAPTIEAQMAKDGQVVTRLADRRPNADDTIDSKVYVRLTISSAEQLPPRQTSTVGVEVSDVQRAIDDLGAAALSAGGRQVDNPAMSQNAGQVTATVQYDVPLAQIQTLADKVDAMGVRKSRQTGIDTHAPEGKLARARLTVTFATPASLSNADDGLWAGIRRGLVTSLRVLSYSLTLIIIGLCVVVPFWVVLWGMWRIVKRVRKTPTEVTPATA